MQNEFEEQVQQKMDELHFVPTPPVWEKIEAQIRRKKERRRFFLWLPLLFLLAATICWWMISAPPHTGRNGQPALASTAAAKPATTQPATIANAPSSATQTAAPSPAAATVTAIARPNENPSQNTIIATSSLPASSSHFSKTPAQHSAPSAAPNHTTARRNTTAIDTLDLDYYNQVERLYQGVHQATAPSADIVSPSISYSPSVPYAHPLFALTPLHPSPFHLPLPPAGPHHAAPLKKTLIGLTVSGGWSGLSPTTASAATADYLNAPLGTANTLPRSPLVGGAGPLPVRGRSAFAIGLAGERRLSDKPALAAGLGYSYFSTLIGQNRSTGAAVRTPFPQGGSFTGTSKQTPSYTNRFHFISLPVSLRWRAARRLPLGLYTGLTVRQLLSTNALQYNYQTQVYDRSAGAFRHTQLYAQMGVDYQLKSARSEWRIGPQFEYGIGPVSAGGPHLYNFSLRLQYLLRK